MCPMNTESNLVLAYEKVNFCCQTTQKKIIQIKQSKGRKSIPFYFKSWRKTDYDGDLTTA